LVDWLISAGRASHQERRRRSKVIELKSPVKHGVLQEPCPYNYWPHMDVRIGSTYCERCEYFVSKRSSVPESEQIGPKNFDVFVVCNNPKGEE